MKESPYQLILYPKEYNFQIDQKELISVLQSLEFVGNEIMPSHYQVGERFLSHLCYMGCSPNIELEPQLDDKPFTYVRLPELKDSLGFQAGVNVKPARCPECKGDLKLLVEELNQQSGSSLLSASCPHCEKQIKPLGLNWRKSAVYGYSQIIIGEIYESEAVPDTQFLGELEKQTGASWVYSYLRLK